MRGRRRARTWDLMIRSPPLRWDTILDRIASDRCQPRAGLQGYTELARISQRVMRTSSSDPCRFRRTGVTEYPTAEAVSLRLDAGGFDHFGPLFGIFGDELAEVDGRARQGLAEVSETDLHLGVGESRVDLLVELVDDLGWRVLGNADAIPR